MHDHPEVLALLLKASKTKLTEKRYNGQCPMALALVRGSSRMVRLMLEIGEIDPNEELPYGAPQVKCPHPMPSRGSADGTPLVIAVKNGHANLVETLLNYPGVDPNLVSGSVTPLDLAIAEDRAEVVKVFLRHQDKLERSLCALRKPLLHVAAHKGAASVIKMLINCYGADPNTYDDQKQTILCSAISNYQWKVVEYLVQCPAVDVNLAGHSGLGDNVGPNIPLQMAAHQQNYIALGYLMKRDDLDLNWSGVWGTALSIAVETSNQWAMKTLLYDSGVDVNRTSEISPGPSTSTARCQQGATLAGASSARTARAGGLTTPAGGKVRQAGGRPGPPREPQRRPQRGRLVQQDPLWWASRGGAQDGPVHPVGADQARHQRAGHGRLDAAPLRGQQQQGHDDADAPRPARDRPQRGQQVRLDGAAHLRQLRQCDDPGAAHLAPEDRRVGEDERRGDGPRCRQGLRGGRGGLLPAGAII
uniref:Uncharacterized protein n=1 Tax=Bionectria ochroleuca TaxID=29856 RepID=A0A8H7NI47_BIOOC